MKTRISNTLFILLATLVTLSGCTTNYKYKIGVSQCVGGAWRDKANVEMLSAQHLYDNDVKVIIKNADNNNERQCLQIDSLVDEGVDLLVVSPNDYHALNGSLQRAREKNIPIVFFDRTTALKDYTAYIGGDNVEAGRKMAEYAVLLCRDSVKTDGRRPIVLEMTGPLAISPAAQRHAGFSEVISNNPSIDYCHLPSQWSYDDCKRIMREWLENGKAVDVVFCHSDLAAVGAYEAAKELHKEREIRFLGIDGLPGEGLDAVQNGQLAASYIYSTHGEEVIALALRILEGKPFKRTNNLKSIVVTPQNVADIALSSHSLQKQNTYLSTIQTKLETYLGFYHIQRALLIVSLLVILLLAVAVFTTWRAVRATRRANRRMRELFKTQNLNTQNLNTTPSQHLTTQNSPSPDRRFLDTFLKAMEKHMSNTNLKIEDLGDEVGLSRVQLYRKVKALTGMTPVEILRETRLKRAMQLLKTTDKTVSEIANEVGFATPGYFSSCFKKQYDKYPTDVREEMKV